MKRILSLVALFAFVGSTGWSQSLESVKTVVMLGQMDKAKADFDKAAANPKFLAKPEAYALKTAIYAALSMTDQNRNTSTGHALALEADAAFTKYKSLEPELTKFSEETIYQNGPINIYSNYYNQGLASYNEMNWNEAIPKLQKAIDYSDFLIEKKLLPFPLDTNLLILTGVVGERAKNGEVTTMAYGRLVDAKVTGTDFEGVYQYLVRYYFQNKDLANFEKLKTMGAQLYPESDFFKLDRLDFAVGLVDGFTDKLNALNNEIDSLPNNYKAHELRWSFIYDELATLDEDISEVLSKEFTEIKLESEGGVSKIPCKVNGLDLSFVFDTGAANVSISLTEAAYMLKNGKMSPDDIVGTSNMQDAKGEISVGYIVNLKELIVADYILKNVKATIVQTANAPLLLGQSAMKQLGKFQLDLTNNLLILSKSPDSKDYESRRNEIIQQKEDLRKIKPQLEETMLVSLNKCSKIKPQEVKNFLFLGSYYVGKKEAANEARIKHNEDMQKRTKPGTKALPADIAKRDQLDKEYQQTLEMILEPYLGAAAIYSAKTQLDAREKQQYKNIAGYLAEIYETKKKRAPKDKPAEAAKWAAEEKKWNEVYESIK